jgi:putative endonuclease
MDVSEDTSVWWVYLVMCRDGTLYAGVSNNVLARLEAHNAGRGARYTRARRPVEMVWCQPVGSRGEAQKVEWAVKHVATHVKRTVAQGEC